MTIKVTDLKKQQLFENCSNEDLKVVSKLLDTKSFSKGDYIFKEKEPTAGIYMIKSGKAELKRNLTVDMKTKMLIMLRNISSSEIRHTSDGWVHIFATPGEGEFFGELSIIEGREKHGADGVAFEDTELFLLKTDKFNELENSNPLIMSKIMKAIAKVVSKTLRHLDKRLLNALTGQ